MKQQPSSEHYCLIPSFYWEGGEFEVFNLCVLVCCLLGEGKKYVDLIKWLNKISHCLYNNINKWYGSTEENL